MWDVEIEQTKQRASSANKVIEQLTEQLALYAWENSDQRLLVALPLLQSSIDVAAAATRLLTTDPVQYGSAAEAMFRPQLERYMRAVFFGSSVLSTDAEVLAFFENDEMPKRKPPNNPNAKARTISFDMLTQSVAEEVIRQTGKDGVAVAQGFADAIRLERDDLHGAVHGGRMVIRRYLTDVLAHNPWALAQGALINAMMLFSILALSQAAHLHGVRNGGAEFRVTSAFGKLLREILPGMPEPTGSAR